MEPRNLPDVRQEVRSEDRSRTDAPKLAALNEHRSRAASRSLDGDRRTWLLSPVLFSIWLNTTAVERQWARDKRIQAKCGRNGVKRSPVFMESDASRIPPVLNHRGVGSRCSGWSETETATAGSPAHGHRWSRCAARTGGATRAPVSCRGHAAKTKPWRWRIVAAAEVRTQRPLTQKRKSKNEANIVSVFSSAFQVEAWGKASRCQQLQGRLWRLNPETWKWKVRSGKGPSSNHEEMSSKGTLFCVSRTQTQH